MSRVVQISPELAAAPGVACMELVCKFDTTESTETKVLVHAHALQGMQNSA